MSAGRARGGGGKAPLDLARDSLEDAALLAARGRRNAAILRECALRHALTAISLGEGLDVPDTLGLDTLLRRVPALHPQAALVARLGDPAARTQAAIGRLITALESPRPPPEPKPEPEPKPQPAQGARSGARAAHAPTPRPATGANDGPTAFDSAPRGAGRPATAPEATSAAFWALIDRWEIGDADALALIRQESGLTRKGTRGRFRLVGEPAARYAALRRIDTALEMLGRTPAWLRRPQRASPFDGRSPVATMIADPDGIAATIRVLTRQGLSGAAG